MYVKKRELVMLKIIKRAYKLREKERSMQHVYADNYLPFNFQDIRI